MLYLDVERYCSFMIAYDSSLSAIQETMHPQRCISSGTKEEGEGKPPFLLSHKRSHVS